MTHSKKVHTDDFTPLKSKAAALSHDDTLIEDPYFDPKDRASPGGTIEDDAKASLVLIGTNSVKSVADHLDGTTTGLKETNEESACHRKDLSSLAS